jgi:four helix bundle protein
VNIARGSLAETETFLLLAVRTGLLKENQAATALSVTGELGRMLTVLRQRLNADPL